MDYQSVKTSHIEDLAVKTAQIDNAAITSAKINDLAVTTLKIQDEAVTVPSGIFNTNAQTNLFSRNNGASPNNVNELYATQDLLNYTVKTNGGKLRVDSMISYDSLITINSYPANLNITSILVMVAEVLINDSVVFKQEIYPISSFTQSGQVIRFVGVTPTPVYIHPASSSTLNLKLRISYSPKYTGIFFGAYSSNATISKVVSCSLATMELKK
jgi:hypothetical protein